MQTDGFDRCPRFLQAHRIANSIINPRLSDNLYFELSARICTSQVFIQPNPIGFQQEFSVPDGLSVPANLRLVIVPLIHPSDAPFLVRGHLPYQSLPIGRCSLFRGIPVIKILEALIIKVHGCRQYGLVGITGSVRQCCRNIK